jgi:hypothetical protein
MDRDVLHHLEGHVFYHGTSLEAAESIAREGFRVWFTDPECGRYTGYGNLGTGVYITCNWRTALWFGPVLLRVAVRPGTRLLNAILPPDEKCIDSMCREFGREILRKSPWKVLPKNKKLRLHEVIGLFRYHYRRTWEKDYGRDRDGFMRWPRRQEMHSHRLDDFRSVLIRYGYDGYGNPEDDNGIVVFAAERLSLEEVVAEIPSSEYVFEPFDSRFSQFADLEEVRRLFRRSGSSRAKRLADRVAGRRADAGDEAGLSR